MQGGAAAARSRPSNDLHQGLLRMPVYSLFPMQAAHSSTIHKVTERLISSSLSTLGVQTPPPFAPGSPLHLEFNSYSQRVTVRQTTKETTKMEETKLGMQCITDPSCCPGGDLQRQMLENVTSAMQPLAVKTEVTRKTCCLTNSPKKIMPGQDGGCSRTNPVTWLGLGQNVQVQVKREPQQLQMSDLVAVKLEQASPGNKHDPPHIPSSLNNGSIPVGIAVARQRVGDAGLLAALSQKDNQHRLHDIDAAQAAMAVGMTSVLCDDRPAPIAWPAPPQQPPAAPLWQYPAPMAMDSMMMGSMGNVGMGSVGTGVSSVGGFQLVRDPTSGALLLLPTPADVPHAVVWGGVPYPSAPLLLPQAPHPSHHLQLLSGDLLASTATLQHTHTHSTRLVTLAPAPPPQQHPIHTDKRKPLIQPMIAPHTLIKIEAEPIQEKQQPFIPEPQPLPQPIIPNHIYYQPEIQEQVCRSQATSPAAPPTPPPETHGSPAHKDASNQTDHIEEDDDSPNHADDDERDVACVGVAHFPEEHSHQIQSMIDSAEESSSEALATSAVVGAVEKAISAIERDDVLGDSSSSGGSHDLVIDTGTSPSPSSQQSNSRPPVDVSGLELLSNSIEQYERSTPGHNMPALDPTPLTVDTRTNTNIIIKTSPKTPPRTETEPHRRFEFPSNDRNKPSLDGLGLLCALAEQRFMEEVETPTPTIVPSRPFVKSEHSLSSSRRRSTEKTYSKKEKHRHRDDSSSERRRKRSRDREERLRHKLEKMRRRHRERDEGRNNNAELEASLRRVTTCGCGLASCTHVPSANAIVEAMEKDMRERLKFLQRQCDEKRAQLHALTPPLPTSSTPSPSTPALSPDSDRGSSKKRKVGRPRKVSSPDLTETIVAKKPKSKSSLVGYLLAKGKLKGGILCSSKSDHARDEGQRTSKVRPKLKAEPIVKMYSEEEENEYALSRSASSSLESLNEVRQKNREKVDRLARKHSRDDLPELEFALRGASSDSDKDKNLAKKRRKSTKSDQVLTEKRNQEALKPSKCTLTEELLDSSPRVLTARGGLFYAGKLSAVQAPDVYAITLDGERGNKPHILSREETLKDAILEVSPSSVTGLSPGTRVCAYWSQQYRCLYPGTVAEPASPDSGDGKFVAVEFDDGDSGRIAIEDIRLLEPNYPIVEYQNPLFTLGKRRRNTSANSTEERKFDQKPGTSTELTKSDSEERQKERKKLKKHRKEKRRHSSEEDPSDYIKKKKKKHKCCEDHCKHRRHHKKHHRKHRKRHHSSCKEHSSSSENDLNKKSSSDFSKEDSGDSNDRLSTLIAVEKSPEEKMKTVIKKAVLPKKCIVKTAVLDFSNLNKVTPVVEVKDNLKDSGICLDDDASTSDAFKKAKKRTTSSSSDIGSQSANGVAGIAGSGVSKMAAFLPGGALWRWRGAPYRRTAKPRIKKLFYRAIQRGEEIINVGDAAVFLSTGRPDRPYIGRVMALWEARGGMAVRVKWFYHPEETVGLADELKYPGGLFESPHTDENDVQTISHKCEVLPLSMYQDRMNNDPAKYSSVYDQNDMYYLAGNYDPTQQTLKMEQEIPFVKPVVVDSVASVDATT